MDVTAPSTSPILPSPAVPSDTAQAAPLTNPRLSASLTADLDALRIDMEQAQELAADYQRQLAGKSNEFAQLKHLFEKTQADLCQLKAGIAELRQERHMLANEAMKAVALEHLLQVRTGERDRLASEVAALKNVRARESDERVVQLRAQLDKLQQELAAARSEPEPEPVEVTFITDLSVSEIRRQPRVHIGF